ncbi:MAG: hypothetical protein Q6J68_04450 [Thermostichales cyanobacterium SZTDM-1c_bins_54]
MKNPPDYQDPFSQSQILQQRQLLIQERWPEMMLGCTACLRWDDYSRPECCGDCGIGVRRVRARESSSP